eukprot:7391875-Prymnesium_polylepis.5
MRCDARAMRCDARGNAVRHTCSYGGVWSSDADGVRWSMTSGRGWRRGGDGGGKCMQSYTDPMQSQSHADGWRPRRCVPDARVQMRVRCSATHVPWRAMQVDAVPYTTVVVQYY